MRERGQKLQLKNDIKSSKEIVVEYSYSCLFCDTRRVLTLWKWKVLMQGGQTIMICNVPCHNTRKTTLLPYIHYIYIYHKLLDQMNGQKGFQIFEIFNFITKWNINCILYNHISLLLFFINNSISAYWSILFFWKGLRARIGCLYLKKHFN